MSFSGACADSLFFMAFLLRLFSTRTCGGVLSQLLDVPVLLPQDGNLVPEQHGVQSHPGVQQRHEAKPAAEDVHAGLPLGEVVRVGPPGHLGALGWQKQTRGESISRHPVISLTTTLCCPEGFATLVMC